MTISASSFFNHQTCCERHTNILHLTLTFEFFLDNQEKAEATTTTDRGRKAGPDSEHCVTSSWRHSWRKVIELTIPHDTSAYDVRVLIIYCHDDEDKLSAKREVFINT